MCYYNLKMKKNLILLVFIFFLFPLKSLVLAQTQNQEKDLPLLFIITPQDGQKIFGTNLTVSFLVKNFIFTNPVNRPQNQKNEGHLLVWLDEEIEEEQNAQKIFRAADFTLENLEPGQHHLTLELVNNDGTSLKPPIKKVVNFQIISSPENSPTPNPTLLINPTEPQENKKEEKWEKVQKLTQLSLTVVISLAFFALLMTIGLLILNRVGNK